MMFGTLFKTNNKIFLFLLFIFLLFADQISKLIITRLFNLFESIEIVPYLNFNFVVNYGFAFGFLNSPSLNQLIVSFFIATIIVYFCYLLFKTQDKSFRVNLTLIITGAIGNFIDRIFRGYVVDFIDVYVAKYHWPAFNLADSYISIGFFLLMVNILFLNKKI